MAEYITKSDAVFAACKVLDAFGGCHMGPFCPDSGCREVREVFEDVPAADVVEVVRCRDCEHWMPDGENVKVCTGPLAYCNTDEAWYCASAKRREKYV